jgi:hypothetical protein
LAGTEAPGGPTRHSNSPRATSPESTNAKRALVPNT